MSKPLVLANGKIRTIALQALKQTVDLRTAKPGDPDFWQLLEKADALYSVNYTKINGEFLQKAPNLKVIGQFSVGYDHIDIPACHNRGIRVANTPGVLTDAVADLAYALILDSARKITAADAFVKTGTWGQKKAFGLTTDLAGKTLGIIGMGAIGSAIAARALASKMHIIYHNRHPRPDQQNWQATYTDLDTLLTTADYIVLACTLNPTTKKLINREALNKLKPTASLINISRGAVIDTDALCDILAQGKLRHVALDVTDPEPLPADHPLLKFPNVTVTPHMASATTETRDSMALLTAQNILLALTGKPMLTEIQPAPGANP